MKSPETGQKTLAIGACTRILSTALIVSVVAIHVSGRTTPFVLALLALVIAMVAAREGQLQQSFAGKKYITWVIAALCTWMAITGLWAPNGPDALAKAATAMAFLAGSILIIGWLPHQRDERIAILTFWFWLSYALSASYLLIEFLTDQELKRQFMNAMQWRPSHIYFKYGDSGIESISPNALARSVTILTLLLWPAVFAARLVFNGLSRRIAVGATFAIAATAILLSRSDTNKLALLASTATCLLLIVQATTIRRLMMVAWSIAVLAMVPLALSAFANRLYHADWIPASAQDRIVIWGHTANETLKSPVIGAGTHAAYWIGRTERETAKPPPGGHRQVMTVSTHAHNAFLQIWYELGAIGALLFCATGLLLLDRVGRLQVLPARYAITTFAAFMVVIFSTWGVFQYWFMATFAWTAILTAFTCRLSAATATLDIPDFATRTLRDDFLSFFRLKRI